MTKRNLKGNIILVIAAMIWGLAFVAQDKAAPLVEPFTLNGIRSLIGAAVLLPVIKIFGGKETDDLKRKADNVLLWKAGILCGIFLCIAANFQQFGIALYPDDAAASGRSGFITALYVVLVPLCGIFMKKKVGFTVLIGVAFAVVGMYLLCLGSGLSGVYTGDIVVLCCAVCFSMQILCIDRFIDRVNGVKLSAVQFLTCGVLSLILMLIFEHPDVHNILAARKSILYLGIMSSGVAYTFQIIGQKYSENPTVASILMSLESVFAALGGALLSSERLSPREIIGCAVMFLAIIFAQFPTPNPKTE